MNNLAENQVNGMSPGKKMILVTLIIFITTSLILTISVITTTQSRYTLVTSRAREIPTRKKVTTAIPPAAQIPGGDVVELEQDVDSLIKDLDETIDLLDQLQAPEVNFDLKI